MEYRNLDETTRKFMLQEIANDYEKEKLYKSKVITEEGYILWPELLMEAAKCGNDATLAAALRQKNLIKSTQIANGKVKKVPITAAETLAQGEFNKYYIRGVCLHALANGHKEVTVYRAKNSVNPRQTSEDKIGAKVNAEELLNDIRQNPKTILQIPGGPNSGLSVEL